MRLDTSQQMRTDMRLRMAPRMIQSMEILQLPFMALQERIDQELSENPVLVDLREAGPAEATARRRRRHPWPNPRSTPSPTNSKPDQSRRELERDLRRGAATSRAALSEEADRKHDAMQNMASRPRSLHDDLADQLGFLDCDPRSARWPSTSSTTSTTRATSGSRLHEVVRDLGGDVDDGAGRGGA